MVHQRSDLDNYSTDTYGHHFIDITHRCRVAHVGCFVD